MSTSKNNETGFSLSSESIAEGHGKFPYIIVRMHYAIYMQMPIHFIPKKMEGLRGIMVNSQFEDQAANFPYLLDIASEYKQSLDAKNNRNHRLCVVLSPEQAYYYEENEIRFSPSIPFGGTLVNSRQEIIAMGNSHFIS
ncbi:MAG: hypothetical protein RLZZ155_375 [Bacteroidota bacterium]|jgi:hypothetical protein